MASRPPESLYAGQLFSQYRTQSSRPTRRVAPSVARPHSRTVSTTSSTSTHELPLAPHLARRPPMAFSEVGLRRTRATSHSRAEMASDEGGALEGEDEHMHGIEETQPEGSDVEAVTVLGDDNNVKDDEEEDNQIVLQTEAALDVETLGLEDYVDDNGSNAGEEEEVIGRQRTNTKLIEMYRNHSRQHLDPQDFKAAVQASLMDMVASLDDDKWIYEPEEDSETQA